MTIDVLSGGTEIGPSNEQGHSTGDTSSWFPPFSCIMLMLWNDLVMDDMLLSCWRMLNRLRDVDWVADEC